MGIKVSIPVRTVNTKNLREHWSKRAKRTKEQRAVSRMMVSSFSSVLSGPPSSVTLTRIAPRRLDGGDNLAMSLSAIRDGVADALGINDGDERVAWLYGQRKRKPREYAVEVEIA